MVQLSSTNIMHMICTACGYNFKAQRFWILQRVSKTGGSMNCPCCTRNDSWEKFEWTKNPRNKEKWERLQEARLWERLPRGMNPHKYREGKKWRLTNDWKKARERIESGELSPEAVKALRVWGVKAEEIQDEKDEE